MRPTILPFESLLEAQALTEGTTLAEVGTVWALVADANTYAQWGPWNDGGYDPPAKGPSRPGSVQWFRFGRRTTSVEKILEVDAPKEDHLHSGARHPCQELPGRGHVDTERPQWHVDPVDSDVGQHFDGSTRAPEIPGGLSTGHGLSCCSGRSSACQSREWTVTNAEASQQMRGTSVAMSPLRWPHVRSRDVHHGAGHARTIA